jgi:hypothetical protein
MDIDDLSEQRAIVWAHRLSWRIKPSAADNPIGHRVDFLVEFARWLLLSSSASSSWISEKDAAHIFDSLPKKDTAAGSRKPVPDALLRRIVRWWDKESEGDAEPPWLTSLRDAKRTIDKPLIFFWHVWAMGESYGSPGAFSSFVEKRCCDVWPSVSVSILEKKAVPMFLDNLPTGLLASVSWIPCGSNGPTHHQCLRFRRMFRDLLRREANPTPEQLPIPWQLPDQP